MTLVKLDDLITWLYENIYFYFTEEGDHTIDEIELEKDLREKFEVKTNDI